MVRDEMLSNYSFLKLAICSYLNTQMQNWTGGSASRMKRRQDTDEAKQRRFFENRRFNVNKKTKSAKDENNDGNGLERASTNGKESFKQRAAVEYFCRSMNSEGTATMMLLLRFCWFEKECILGEPTEMSLNSKASHDGTACCQHKRLYEATCEKLLESQVTILRRSVAASR